MNSHPATPGSISFVVVTENGVRQADAIIDVIALARRETDEVILLTRADQAPYLPGPTRPWLRVVGVPDANIFSLRAQIPAVARKEWIVLSEEHAFITSATLVALRAIIEDRPDVDLIPFLAKNIQSISPWAWTSFLHTFAPIWAPVDHAPPFSASTSVVVRRAALGHESPLAEGQWELKTIPAIFASGKTAFSNDVFIDHFKPLNAVSCFLVNFHNARACATLMCRLGSTPRAVRRNGWFTFARRPGELMRAIGARRRELPSGMSLRLRIVGLAHYLGAIAGTPLGPAQSMHRLD